MSEPKKVRMMVSRGNPAGGMIRAGAVVVLPGYWANKFIEDGTAEAVEETKTAEPKAKDKKNVKSKG